MNDQNLKEMADRFVDAIAGGVSKFVKEWTPGTANGLAEYLGTISAKMAEEMTAAMHSGPYYKIGERLSTIERYLENQFLVSQYNYMEQITAMYAQTLKKKPGDIPTIIAIQKIENDMFIIEPRMAVVNAAIFAELEMRHGGDRVFKYARTTPVVKTNTAPPEMKIVNPDK